MINTHTHVICKTYGVSFFRCIEDIENFAYLMGRANDIYTNRIEKLLAGESL